MSAGTLTQPCEVEPVLSGRWHWAGRLRALENSALSLALAAMILLPLLEAALRRTLHFGIVGSTSIVQHLCLLVGMAGAAIAARERRLLTLSNVDEWLLR